MKIILFCAFAVKQQNTFGIMINYYKSFFLWIADFKMLILYIKHSRCKVTRQDKIRVFWINSLHCNITYLQSSKVVDNCKSAMNKIIAKNLKEFPFDCRRYAVDCPPVHPHKVWIGNEGGRGAFREAAVCANAVPGRVCIAFTTTYMLFLAQ